MSTTTLTSTWDLSRSGAVLAPLTFIHPPIDGEKPSFHSAALTGGGERFFFEVERGLALIEDVRTWSSPPSLDREGFSVLRRPSGVADLYDNEAVRGRYRCEVAAVVAEATGAETVVVFDVTRRSDAPEGAGNPDGSRRPAGRLHVDYTEASGLIRARDVLGRERVEAALAAGQPILQLNLWRPIVGPVLRAPLALADASSVRADDLIATDHVFADRVGEIYHLAAHPGQRFGYLSEMVPDEAILIKSFDSRRDGRARFTPHSAFDLPQQAFAPARHSIEARTFAILPSAATREQL